MLKQISQAAPMSNNVHPSKWSALEHICHPRPTLQPAMASSAGQKSSRILAQKVIRTLFTPLSAAADICHFKWDGLLYVVANQGFVSSGYIETRCAAGHNAKSVKFLARKCEIVT